MSKMWRVNINEKTYQMSDTLFQSSLKLPMEKYKEANVNAIYCITKKGTAQMLRETYPDKVKFQKALADYKRKGFKVYYTEAETKCAK